jgi:hypothetical protein
MTDQQQRIASYVSRNPSLSPYVYCGQTMQPPRPWLEAMARQLPLLEHFRRELLEDAEFQALKLGSWLGTTDGQIIADAVSTVISPAYGPAYQLAVKGLTLAAEDQATEGKKTAGKIALGAIFVGGVAALASGGDA